MKVIRTVLALLILGVFGSLYAQEGKGIKFFDGSWEELLEKAKKENKPFFVDFYTSWCYPCKLLERKTFSSPKVGNFANKNFIPYRLNAESRKGLPIARKYGVRAYPTIIFFNSKGEVIGTHIGFVGPDQFLQILEQYSKKATGTLKEKTFKERNNSIPIRAKIIEEYRAQAELYKKK